MALRFSDDRSRLASDEHCVFGIACYCGEVVDGTFHGTIVMNVRDAGDAERWLATGETPAHGVVLATDGQWLG